MVAERRPTCIEAVAAGVCDLGNDRRIVGDVAVGIPAPHDVRHARFFEPCSQAA